MKLILKSDQFDNLLLILWSIILVFLTLSLLLFILTLVKKARRIRRDKIKRRYQEKINHILFRFMFESLDIKRTVRIFKRYFNQKGRLFALITTKSLIELHRIYNGDYQKKLEDFFVESGLSEYSIKLLESRNWMYKVEGIRNLSELSYYEGAQKIKEHLSNKNEMVQEEAILGMIRLKGLDELMDLKDMDIYLSDWLQANIIHIVQSKNFNKPNNFSALLDSKNPTIQLLIARMAQYFQSTEITADLNLIISQSTNLKLRHQMSTIVENLNSIKI